MIKTLKSLSFQAKPTDLRLLFHFPSTHRPQSSNRLQRIYPLWRTMFLGSISKREAHRAAARNSFVL